MLDPWIIEEIRRREEELRKEHDGARLEIQIETPADRDPDRGRSERPTGPGTERGITIIDFGV